MFARNISIHLKSNMLSDYTRTFDKDVLPLLRKQNGFKEPGGDFSFVYCLTSCSLKQTA